MIFPLNTAADMGPKPKITIIVTNPPEDEYYLDILVDYDLPQTDNLKDKRDMLDPKKLKLLENYNKNGWYPALAHGTRLTLWGDLKGEQKDGRMIHTFGYFGVPDRYKIIIVTPQNNVVVTRSIERISYTSTVYYDYKTGAITEQGGLNLAWTYTKQFLMSLIPTLIIEGFILLLFRFKKAQTLVVFFFTNVITLAAMTLFMSTSLLKLGLYSSYGVFFSVEVIITIVETFSYLFLLKEGGKSKRIAYAVTANIVSSLAMLPLMYLEYLLFIY
jgi:hypothetical protein